MSFQELKELFLDADYELDLYITQTQLVGDNLIIDFLVTSEYASRNLTGAEWTLHVLDHRDSRIAFGHSVGLDLRENHPLLWKFNDLQVELYFSGTITDAEKLTVDLMKIDVGLFQNYQPFGTFLNGDIFKLFASGHGLLAKGPKKLLDRYAECLSRHNVVYSLINERQPVYWDGEKWVTETPGHKIIMFGNQYGYVIAKDFDLKKGRQRKTD